MKSNWRQLKRLLGGSMLAVAVLLSLGAGRALAIQSEAAAAVSEGTVAGSADISALEQAYRAHCGRRAEIARRLSLLWFEERELIADYEDTGRSGTLPDFVELAGELRQVRLNIDAARADLSRENKIILAIGDRLPD